jgi:hypothetical protein
MNKPNRKKPVTPASVITSALRIVWLRSRERAACAKRAGGAGKKRKCEACGEAPWDEIHHTRPADMKRIIAVIREELLPSPDKLQALCACCHKAAHDTLKEATDG